MHEKCKVCAHTKITRSPLPKIEKTTSLLHLIYNDVCDMHSTLIEMVNAMLFNAGLGKHFRGATILTASHILNRMPNKKTKVNSL